MKTYLKLSLIAVAAAVAAFQLSADSDNSRKGGTSILHFFVRKTMTNDGAITNATGRVEASQNQQGNANIQRLEFSMRGLETDATYELLAKLDDDTNWIHAANFSTDARGGVKLRYRAQETGNGNGSNKENGNGDHGQGLGKGKLPLPAVLNPIHDIRQLAVMNSSTQRVFTADLTSPDKLQYLIKRPLTNDGTNNAAGSLRLKSNLSRTDMRILASGLETNATFSLVLNGYVAQTGSSDARGRLDWRTQLVSSIDVLDLRSLVIWNSASNSVLSTTLP